MRVHRKVWLWWGRGWAVQWYANRYFSLGIHIDWGRPLVDLHLGWAIIALGHAPQITPESDAQRHTCRGFFIRPQL